MLFVDLRFTIVHIFGVLDEAQNTETIDSQMSCAAPSKALFRLGFLLETIELQRHHLCARRMDIFICLLCERMITNCFATCCARGMPTFVEAFSWAFQEMTPHENTT
jgi:hypothetical protein